MGSPSQNEPPLGLAEQPQQSSSTSLSQPFSSSLDDQVESFLKEHFCVPWQEQDDDNKSKKKKTKTVSASSKERSRRKFERLAESRRSVDALAKADDFWQSCHTHYAELQMELLLVGDSEVSSSTGDASTTAWDELQKLMQSSGSRNLFRASEFELLEKIGHGGYGCVYKARHIPTGHTVALKNLDRDSSSIETHDHRMLPLDCGIVPCYGTFQALAPTTSMDESESTSIQSDLKHWLVLKYCPNGTLKERLIASGKALPKKEAAYILRKVAKIITLLYENHGIVHNDVKPANVLFDYDEPNGGSAAHPKIYLCDLGVARKGQWQSERPGGTYSHMAPEKLLARKQPNSDGHPYHNDYRIDVWAMGIMLYEMSFFAHPFLKYKQLAKCTTMDPAAAALDAKDDKLVELMQCYNTLLFPAQLCETQDGQLLRGMLEDMLNPQPHNRMGLGSIRQHPWMKRHGKWRQRLSHKIQYGLGMAALSTPQHEIAMAIAVQHRPSIVIAANKKEEEVGPVCVEQQVPPVPPAAVEKLASGGGSHTSKTTSMRQLSYPLTPTPSEEGVSHSC